MENRLEQVINYFKEICQIPHGSKNEKDLSNWIYKMAMDNGLEVKQDNLWNLVIHKNASMGYESSNAIIFQAHLDMVCEKVKSSNHNFEKDPIEVIEYFEDGKKYMKANGTTLGADDGIGVAILLMLMLNDDIELPECYFIFTTQEEIGMYGANIIDLSNTNANYLINLDSEEENVATVGCAGGLNLIFTKEEKQEKSSNRIYELEISGLKGGHSGVDIDKGRINSNYLAAMILNCIEDARISSIFGGTKDNVICFNTKVIFSTNMSKDDLTSIVNKGVGNMEITIEDKDLKVLVDELNNEALVYSKETSDSIIELLLNLKQSVIDMSDKMDNLVESSGNIGIVTVDGNEIVINESLRSSVEEKKYEYAQYNKKLAESLGFICKEEGEYPGWDINTNSLLQKVYRDSYINTHNGNVPEIVSIHAGLECGIFAQKNQSIDMISIGPNLYDVHTPNERLDVDSVGSLLNTLMDMINKI